jgi:Domain of unknown function (DUF4232)
MTSKHAVALGGAGLIAALALGVGESAAANGPSARAAARCPAPLLRLTVVQSSSATGHHGYVLRFRNRGSACTLKGYPGVDALSAQGHRVESAQRTKSGFLGGVGPGHPIPQVHLAKGQTASAMVEYLDGPIPGHFCPAAKSFAVTPPGALKSARVSPKSLASERLCNLQVHPVVPGGSGREP